MSWRCGLIVSLLTSAAVAQGFPALTSALERDPGGPAVAVVVVSAGREPLVRVEGLADDAVLPLGDLTRVLVTRALFAAQESEGWKLDQPLAAGGATVLSEAGEPLTTWTWSDVLRDEADGCVGSFRFLDAGERGRSATEVIASHGFAGSHHGWYSHLPWAAVQVAVETRTGAAFATWFETTLADVGMRGVRARSATVPLARREGEHWTDDGTHPVAEVLAAFGASATAADLAVLLEWLIAAPDQHALGFDERGFWPREADGLRFESRDSGATCELRLLPASRSAWFLWSADTGRGTTDALEEALLEDLLGPMTEQEQERFNSAVGLGGGAGGRFGRQRRSLPSGRYQIRFRHFDEGLAIVLDLDGDPSSARLVGTDRYGVVRVRDDRVSGKILLGDGRRVEIDLSAHRGELEGVVAIASERMHLPYRAHAEAQPGDAEIDVVSPDVPRLGRPFDAAMRSVEAELDALFAGVTTGRVVAVGRIDGAVWDGAWGPADPAAGTAMRRGMRVPLGVVTRELFDQAIAFLLASGRLEGRVSLAELRGDVETPYHPRLANLAPFQLAMGVAPAPDYFRLVRDPADARPLDEVLRSHGFYLPRDDEPDGSSALPRALLLEALERGGVIAEWSSYVAYDLAGLLGMPGLLDVSDAARDRAALRLRGPDGVLRPARVAEVACDGNAWARGADVARWLVGLVPEAEDWDWTDKRAEWDAHIGGARGLDAFSRSGDQDDMTSRLVLLPQVGLGVFVWGADGEREWITPAVDVVLGAFWPAESSAWAATWLDRKVEFSGYWTGQDDPDDGRSMVGAPRVFAGPVEPLGQVEVRVGAEPGEVVVVVAGAQLEVIESLTDRRAISVTCRLPGAAAPDGSPGGRLVLLARLRSSGLRGVLALESDGLHRLPYELELPARERP